MKASVIIPTRNRADILARCLDSLTSQTLPAEAFEVLVIDNGSTDDTPEVARRHASLLQLTYVSSPEPGLHVGRHEGMRHAKADVLIFGDDDIEAEPDWVEAVVQSFDDSTIVLVGGNNYPLFEEPPPTWLLRWWEKPANKGRALGSLSILDFGEGVFEIDPGYVWGCNFSIRRDVLKKVGGFHPDGMPKERLHFRGDGETHVSNMVRNSTLRTLFNSRASVRHLVSKDRMTKEYFEQRAYSQGISDSYTDIRRYGGPHIPLPFRMKRRIRSSRYVMAAYIRSVMQGEGTVGRQMHEVRYAAAIAYRKGYESHQKKVQDDPLLLAWVLKESYL